jgi:tetratricopeptide (TPR) repeat protein
MPTYLLIACLGAYALATAGGFRLAVRLHRYRVQDGDTQTLVFQSRWNWVAQPVLSGILLLVYKHWVFAIPLAYVAAYWGIMARSALSGNVPRRERPSDMTDEMMAVASRDARVGRELLTVVFVPTLLTVVGVITVSASAAVVSAWRIPGPRHTSSLWWLIPLLALAAGLACWMAGAIAGAAAALAATWSLKRKRNNDDKASSAPPSIGDAKRQLRALEALNDRLEQHLSEEDYEAAIQTSNEIHERFGSTEDPEFVRRVALALLNKGPAVQSTHGWGEALDVYNEIVRRYEANSDVAVRRLVATALVRRGIGLGQLGRNAEAREAFDAVVERFGQAREPVILRQCAHALWFKGSSLLKAGRRDEAFELLFKSVKVHPDVRFEMAIDSNLHPLKDDDRWARLMRPE